MFITMGRAPTVYEVMENWQAIVRAGSMTRKGTVTNLVATSDILSELLQNRLTPFGRRIVRFRTLSTINVYLRSSAFEGTLVIIEHRWNGSVHHSVAWLCREGKEQVYKILFDPWGSTTETPFPKVSSSVLDGEIREVLLLDTEPHMSKPFTLEPNND